VSSHRRPRPRTRRQIFAVHHKTGVSSRAVKLKPEVWLGSGLAIVGIAIQAVGPIGQALGLGLSKDALWALFALTVGLVLVGVAMTLSGFGALDALKRLRVRSPIFRQNAPEAPVLAARPADGLDWEQLDALRLGQYQRNRGLFLVHSWRPSSKTGQKVDVTIKLAQHERGPLSWRTIKSVEYIFGRRFEDHARTVTRPDDDFAVVESLYGPLLVLARVSFTDGHTPLILSRYVNFDGDHDPGREAVIEVTTPHMLLRPAGLPEGRGSESDLQVTIFSATEQWVSRDGNLHLSVRLRLHNRNERWKRTILMHRWQIPGWPSTPEGPVHLLVSRATLVKGTLEPRETVEGLVNHQITGATAGPLAYDLYVQDELGSETKAAKSGQ
jgi:hypothetical protein